MKNTLEERSFLTILSSCILTIFIASCCINCPEEVKTESIDSPPIDIQKTPVWCWAASIQNALAAYGVKITQEEIVITTYGTVTALPLFDPQQAALNLLASNYRVAPSGKVIHPFFVTGPPRPDVLVREIKREKSPLLVFYQNPQGGGHVVVCYGISYTGEDAAPMITEILVKDPWDAVEKKWPGGQMASLWNSTIFLRVAPIPQSPFMCNGGQYTITPTFEAQNIMTGLLEGRIWYFNEYGIWKAINPYGIEVCTLH